MHQPIDTHDQTPGIKTLGSHICQFYTTQEEHASILSTFFNEGIAKHRKCICVTDSFTKDDLITLFDTRSMDIRPYFENGQMVLFSSSSTYTTSDTFSSDRILQHFVSLCNASIAEGYSGLYVSGDLEKNIGGTVYLEQLLEYESRVNTIIPRYPISGLCLYNASLVTFTTVYQVLRLHPELRVDDVQMHSPYFIQKEILEKINNRSIMGDQFLPILHEIKLKKIDSTTRENKMLSHVSELELLTKLTVERELKMIELKNKIAELESKLPKQ